MNPVEEMQNQIIQLEEELRKKNNEFAKHNARFEVFESKLTAMCLNQPNTRNSARDASVAQKMLVNTLEMFKRTTGESLDSFTGHMDLYLAQIPEEMYLKVAVSYLSGHASDWFKVISEVE